MNYGNEMRRRGKAQQQHLFRYFRLTIHLNAKDGKHETMKITSGVLQSARSEHGLYIGSRPQANEVALFHPGKHVPGHRPAGHHEFA